MSSTVTPADQADRDPANAGTPSSLPPVVAALHDGRPLFSPKIPEIS